MKPARGPASVLCVVEVTKSQSLTGFGCSPAATSPAKCAMSQSSSAPTSSAISRKRSVSTVRGYAEPPQTISFGLCSFASWRTASRSEEHTSELQSHSDLVCRLLLEKKKNTQLWPHYSEKQKNTNAT